MILLKANHQKTPGIQKELLGTSASACQSYSSFMSSFYQVSSLCSHPKAKPVYNSTSSCRGQKIIAYSCLSIPVLQEVWLRSLYGRALKQISNLSTHKNHLEILIKLRFLGLTFRDSDSVDQGGKGDMNFHFKWALWLCWCCWSMDHPFSSKIYVNMLLILICCHLWGGIPLSEWQSNVTSSHLQSEPHTILCDWCSWLQLGCKEIQLGPSPKLLAKGTLRVSMREEGIEIPLENEDY